MELHRERRDGEKRERGIKRERGGSRASASEKEWV